MRLDKIKDVLILFKVFFGNVPRLLATDKPNDLITRVLQFFKLIRRIAGLTLIMTD